MSENENVYDSLPAELREQFAPAEESKEVAQKTELSPEEIERFRQFQQLQQQETGSVAKELKSADPAPATDVASKVYADTTIPLASSASEETEEVSETFAQISKEIGVPAAPAPTPAKVVPFSPLDNVRVDLNNIEFVEKSALEGQKDYAEVFQRKRKTAVYQVVCAQSAYGAMLSALNLADINSITNANVDLYTHKRRLYEAVFAHMESTTVGKIGFKDWLKTTSFHDLDTLLYGIYCQTFPENNQFDITCGSCQKSTPLTVNNVTLVESKDDAIYGRIGEVIKEVNSLDKLNQHSLVHRTERMLLPESKILVEIHTPSLWDHLELLNNVDPKYVRDHNDSIGTMLFIKTMGMPDVERIARTGQYACFPVTDKNAQMDILLQLSIKDGDFLNEAIQKRAEKYAITYSVKGAKCSHCHDSLGDLPIDIENALFTQIQRRNQG